MAGAAAQAAPTRPSEPIDPAHPAHCVKKVDRITWRDPGDNRYLQITDASKKDGAIADTAKRNKAAKNQEWDAHRTCEFSQGGLDLWSFQNVHSGLCLAIGPVPHNHVDHDVAQHPCGKNFTRWMFTESPVFTDINNHRKFHGYMLNLLKQNAPNNTGLVICDGGQKSLPYFDDFADAAAGGGCLWR
jgi:hypothetical protein